MCREEGGPACRIPHIDVEWKRPHALTSSSLSRRALASLGFTEMKEEQNALSPMRMPRMMILGVWDLFISGGNGLTSCAMYKLKFS